MTTSPTAPVAWPESDGIVYDRGGVRWIDVREMTWTPTPGREGHFHKMLERDAAGAPIVFVEYLPPGVPATAFRRHHRSVREFFYILEGELPIVEFADEDDTTGVELVARRGWFADRRPGSVYGGSPDLPSGPGAVVLRGRTGPGTWSADPGYGDETVELAPGAGAPAQPPAPETPGLMLDHGGVTWFDTRDMAWEEFRNAEPGHLRKVLCENPENGAPGVYLHQLPPAYGMGGELPVRCYHRTIGEYGYILEGEIFNAEWETADGPPHHLRKRPDWFMARQPGSIHGADVGQVPARGCLLLNWAPDIFGGVFGNWIGDANYEEETIVLG